MKFLPLVWRNLFRRKTRTIFTFLSILVAFVLFGFLMTIRLAFTMGVDVAGVDRLMMTNKMSLIQPLPIAYQPRIERTRGVVLVTHNSWFGGIYQDRRNFFAQIVVEPEPFLKMYPEYRLPDDQLRVWLSDRQGAVAGRDLAERFGWSVGDRIPINGTVWRPKTGGSTWEFNLVGIYDGAPEVDKTQFFFRYDYFDETRTFGAGAVGWYLVKIDDPARAAEIAGTLDAQFANSSFETKTATEKVFVQSFANQIGNIGAIMVAILIVALFLSLLVTANTMAQSVRERTNELAMLKTLGYSDGLILTIVLLESVAIALAGGLIGLGIGWALISQGDPTGGMLPIFTLRGRDMLVGVALMIALGVLAGLLPALGAMRLRIVDALRRN
jgi:putative ABC transport system permease protein